MAGHFKFLPVLLLAIFTFSASGQLIASINCGTSDVMIGKNLIQWSPDDQLISNGIARVVPPSHAYGSDFLELNTLRVFTSRKKNCYSIGQKLKGVKVLVRARFNYGNYDGLSSPPTFDLHFDGNFWATVQTYIGGTKSYEVIYVANGDSISVCVAQTKPNQFPYMSTLEVRRLDPEIYKEVEKSRALFLRDRLCYGSYRYYRYPTDTYDRYWSSAYGVRYPLRTEAYTVNTTAPNNPPEEIFKNASTVYSTTDALYLLTVSPMDPPIYVNFYFTEATFFRFSLTRSFRIYEISASGSRPLSPPISPPTFEVVESFLYNYTVSSISNISLIATVDSDFPPLINAMEAFNISGVLTDGTNSNDVAALALLQRTFEVLRGWNGDPCLPAPYSWDWLNCNNDARPRITSLHLDSFNLSGSLPDISSLDALEIIDLHNNTLNGSIPSFLGTMPNLKRLNLAYNRFSGPIPTSLSNKNKVELVVTGNPSLCTSGNSCSSSASQSEYSFLSWLLLLLLSLYVGERNMQMPTCQLL
ncbi:malectin-like carbohydrate-binding domain-containing protein [Artemisia annua]|uniref:Malectin-like carbohydrate-binding domain-containing protein n=1 Tax=Artemisia annua TaxID=35608 RepID=A0A2U1MKZ2_ARTAN|nr:malectin-like carbohydrate-binding domain-containing protein [Artemisia annua]